MWFSWVTTRGCARQGEVLASIRPSSRRPFTSAEVKRRSAFEYRLSLVAIGWQPLLRCSNSHAGAFVTAACNTLRFNIGLDPPKWMFSFWCSYKKSCPKIKPVRRPFKTVTRTLPYTWPRSFTVTSEVPTLCDFKPLTANPTQWSHLSSCTFIKRFKRRSLTWFRFDPGSAKALASTPLTDAGILNLECASLRHSSFISMSTALELLLLETTRGARPTL